MPNAQALDQLISAGPQDPRILKATSAGVVDLAVERTDYGTVSGPAISGPENIAIWNIDGDGRTLEDSGFSVAELEALAEEAALSAEESAASAVEASAAAADAAAEAESAGASAAAAAAAAATALAISLLGVRRGARGDTGDTGATGATGANGLAGAPGAAGASGKTTLIIDSNINVVGGRIQDIAASPQADYDAVNAKWVWDLLNDNVEIKWE